MTQAQAAGCDTHTPLYIFIFSNKVHITSTFVHGRAIRFKRRSIAWDESHLALPYKRVLQAWPPPMRAADGSVSEGRGPEPCNVTAFPIFSFSSSLVFSHCNILFIFNLQRVMPLPAQAEDGAAPLRGPRNASITVTRHYFLSRSSLTSNFKSFLFLIYSTGQRACDALGSPYKRVLQEWPPPMPVADGSVRAPRAAR